MCSLVSVNTVSSKFQVHLLKFGALVRNSNSVNYEFSAKMGHNYRYKKRIKKVIQK